MPRKKSSLLHDLSTADLKRLLAARERIDVLEVEKARLAKELARVEKELAKLLSDASRAGGKVARKVRRKKTGKKTAAKAKRKATKKKVVKKKVVKKKVAKKKIAKKKTTKKKAARKSVGRKAPRKKSTASKSKSSGKMKLEDVIVAVIRKKGSPIPFQDLKTTITKGKLFKTKSGNFDNVLRRTLSTSKAVKRVGRGIYDVA
jgi:adenylate kinase